MTDDITIEEAKRFLTNSQIERKNWLACAEQSWNELKKQKKTGTLWSVMPNSARKRVRYPLWYSTFKIRKPLVYARTPIPIGRDTSGLKDTIGEVAAIMIERLAKSLMKANPIDEAMCSARDDMLATQFGLVRGYYECKESEEEQKIPLQVQFDEAGNPHYFNGPYEIPDDAPVIEESGRLYTPGKKITIEQESVCLKPVLYRDFYFDPTAYRWSDGNELAFAYDYSEPMFKAVFGKDAYEGLSLTLDKIDGPKGKRLIRVYEYWNKLKGKVGWFTEGSDDFIKRDLAKDSYIPESEGKLNGKTFDSLYDLQGFWPCPKPMVFDAPTDSFWPIPEWYQYNDILEEIHNIASNIFILSRAIRIRALFDNSVPGLQSLVNEVGNADWIGIDNLMSALNKAGGNIENVVAYLPIAPMVDGLNNMYQALNQRLDSFAKLSGSNDMVQGESESNTGKTLGERQMEGKFAMNQIYPYQIGMQEFACEAIELMCEIALKNFNDDSLAQHIMPETMEPEHQGYYQEGLNLLKSDRKRRFRIELETDSTSHINEMYDMQSRQQTSATLQQALQATADIMETNPKLGPPMLLLTQNLVKGFRQGKVFMERMDSSLEAILEEIEMSQQNPEPPPPDPKLIEIQANRQTALDKMRVEQEIAYYDMQVKERIETSKIEQNILIERINASLAQLKMQEEQGAKVAELQLEYNKLNASIAEAQFKAQNDRDELILELRKITDKKEADVLQAMVEQHSKPFELQLEQSRQQLDIYELQLKRQEQVLREQEQAIEVQQQQLISSNQQFDNSLQQVKLALEAQALQHEISKPPELPPINVQVLAPEIPKPSKKKKKLKVTRRNAEGDAEEYEQVDEEVPS